MLLLLGTLLLLLVIGVPVAVAIGLSSVVYVLVGDTTLRAVALAQMTTSGADAYILLAVPFFILAGELMNAGGITRRLVAFAVSLVGWARGGLAYVVVIVNMVMAGVSGAAIADAAAVGSVMIPSMVRAGYRPGFAAALNAAAATVGPVIPPSVGFIIYASLANVSVGKLFLAGAVPGLVLGLYLMGTCYVIARTRGLPRTGRAPQGALAGTGSPEEAKAGPEETGPLGRGALRGLWDALPALLMPAIILGGIVGGVVTPTEAGVLAVLYGLLVGAVVYRELRTSDLPYLFAKAARQTATILYLIASAKAFGWLLTREGAPAALTSGLAAIDCPPWAFLLIFNVATLALGCFLEGGSLMIILTPILLPVLDAYGIDPVHFGVVFQLNIMVGLLTPPVGMLLFVIAGVSRVPLGEIIRELWPFLLALLLALALVTYVPAVTMMLPSLL